jgi:hypothetical protein
LGLKNWTSAFKQIAEKGYAEGYFWYVLYLFEAWR